MNVSVFTPEFHQSHLNVNHCLKTFLHKAREIYNNNTNKYLFFFFEITQSAVRFIIIMFYTLFYLHMYCS